MACQRETSRPLLRVLRESLLTARAGDSRDRESGDIQEAREAHPDAAQPARSETERQLDLLSSAVRRSKFLSKKGARPRSESVAGGKEPGSARPSEDEVREIDEVDEVDDGRQKR